MARATAPTARAASRWTPASGSCARNRSRRRPAPCASSLRRREGSLPVPRPGLRSGAAAAAGRVRCAVACCRRCDGYRSPDLSGCVGGTPSPCDEAAEASLMSLKSLLMSLKSLLMSLKSLKSLKTMTSSGRGGVSPEWIWGWSGGRSGRSKCRRSRCAG